MSDSRRKKSELSKYEWDMLQEYIRITGEPDFKFNYSVRVGTGADTENIKEVWLRKLIEHNTKLRIDCIKIELSGDPEIIEVKKVAAPGAIGQLLSYKKLYDEEYGTRAEMTLLCRYASDTMLKLCDSFGIKVKTVGTYN